MVWVSIVLGHTAGLGSDFTIFRIVMALGLDIGIGMAYVNVQMKNGAGCIRWFGFSFGHDSLYF
jgi:hypothetical protein